MHGTFSASPTIMALGKSASGTRRRIFAEPASLPPESAVAIQKDAVALALKTVAVLHIDDVAHKRLCCGYWKCPCGCRSRRADLQGHCKCDAGKKCHCPFHNVSFVWFTFSPFVRPAEWPCRRTNVLVCVKPSGMASPQREPLAWSSARRKPNPTPSCRQSGGPLLRDGLRPNGFARLP
jgi:hypothetical protein